MTVETIDIILEALAFYGKYKAGELEKATEERKQERRGAELDIDLAAIVKERTAREEFEAVAKALAEFRSIGVKLVNKQEHKKPFWRR